MGARVQPGWHILVPCNNFQMCLKVGAARRAVLGRVCLQRLGGGGGGACVCVWREEEKEEEEEGEEEEEEGEEVLNSLVINGAAVISAETRGFRRRERRASRLRAGGFGAHTYRLKGTRGAAGAVWTMRGAERVDGTGGEVRPETGKKRRQRRRLRRRIAAKGAAARTGTERSGDSETWSY